jgi:DUF3046 family protein
MITPPNAMITPPNAMITNSSGWLLAWTSMRLTEFWMRMESRFGAGYADSVARDQVIGRLGNRTVHQALAQGESAKDVWRAVCEHFEIPVADRH